jgi:hypothetical protein
MPVIHVLEVRYAPAKEGPWTEAKEKQVTDDPPHDWTPVRIAASGDVARNFIQARIVPYLRLDKRPGSEVPEALGAQPPGRNVLGWYGSIGLGWQIARYDFLERRWTGARPFLGEPDWWIELPPPEEQPR